MPPLPSDEEGSDVDIPSNGVSAHTQSKVEADVAAKDQLKDELMDDIAETKGATAAKEEAERVSPTNSNEDDDDDVGEDEEAYEVESIIGHKFVRKQLLYEVKWKGWSDADNTWEPESNLEGSRDIVAAYHHKIGGAPQPRLKSKASKKSLNDTIASSADDSAPPPAKRQKRSTARDAASETPVDEDNFGDWVPKGLSWENDIKQIETVERDEASQDLYILLIFKNGRNSRVKNGIVRKKCPQRLLDFYEAHLNFSVGNFA